MSVFRPSARATGPDGEEWEIYAFRIRLPARPPYDPGGSDLELGRAPLPNPFDTLAWLLGNAGVMLVRLLWDLPRAVLEALGSDEWTIEAVTWSPHRTTLTWRTTREYRGHVLAQVEGQLARGETPTPNHATYLGTLD